MELKQSELHQQKGGTFWPYGERFVETLLEDLGECKWKEFAKANLANLFNYMVRRGYKIVLHETHQLTFWMQKMIIVSFNPDHLQLLLN
jgi:hypothetical protein